MPVTLKVKITGDKETIARLRKVGFDVTDFSQELKDVGQYVADFFSEDVFQTEGGVFGRRWAPLSPIYGLRKGTKWGFGKGVLEASGTLRKSFYYKAGRSKVAIGNTQDYARHHQFGTRKMPQRVIAELDQPRVKRITDILRDGLHARVRRTLGQ